MLQQICALCQMLFLPAVTLISLRQSKCLMNVRPGCALMIRVVIWWSESHWCDSKVQLHNCLKLHWVRYLIGGSRINPRRPLHTGKREKKNEWTEERGAVKALIRCSSPASSYCLPCFFLDCNIFPFVLSLCFCQDFQEDNDSTTEQMWVIWNK